MVRDGNGQVHLDARWVGVALTALGLVAGTAVGYGVKAGTDATEIRTLRRDVEELKVADAKHEAAVKELEQKILGKESFAVYLKFYEEKFTEVNRRLVTIEEQHSIMIRELRMHRKETLHVTQHSNEP